MKALLLLLHLIVLTCRADTLDFYDGRFRDRVQDALKAVGTILDNTRHPVLPEDTDHTYDDKYALVDTITNTLIASSMTVFEKLGLSSEMLENVLTKVHNEKRPISLHFHMDQACTFDKQTERKVIVSETETETSNGGSGLMGRLISLTENVKVKATVQEYHWNVTTPYKICLKLGDDEEIELQSRSDMKTTIIVSGGGSSRKSDRKPPPPLNSIIHDLEVNLTWLFQQIVLEDGKPTSTFSIDRLSETCKTPRRNSQIEDASKFQEDYHSWALQAASIFRYLEYSVIGSSSGSSQRINSLRETEAALKNIFSPIVPLFEDSSVLPKSDFDLFLSTHNSSLDNFITGVKSRFPGGGFVSPDDALMISLLHHLSDVILSWAESVDYVESMLRIQLVQAIGKELTAKDFDKFIGYYSKKIFGPDYVPRPFSYAVRREDHYPDGMVSIETEREGEREPVDTMVRRISGGPSIFIPVDAATSVEIHGDRFLHGWIQHRWGMDNGQYKRNLVARAHQFSSFMIILGVMGGSNTFIPKDAIILQNKDEVLIPLLTNVLPSAKEFKDSIASLSTEQRAFAEAYRKMQLESSVFAVCIIQIKPQLERLLNLPEGALTKEIQLTQDLMSLFVDHQIPSDLLSFDGPSDEGTSAKVDKVKEYATAVMDVIAKAKEKQIEEEKQKAKMREKMKKDAPTSTPTASEKISMAYLTSSFSRESGSNVRPLSATEAPRRRMQEQDQLLAFDEMDEAPSLAEKDKAEGRDGSYYDGKSSESFTQLTHQSDDFTLIPTMLDAKFEQYDEDGALKSTIIKAGRDWTRSRQENLLVVSQKTKLDSDTVASERNKAMDLLTAISRSGSLSIESSELHVIVAVSHCFEKQIMETIIEDNINPIEKMERSMMMIASVIHDVAEGDLLCAEKKKEKIEGKKGNNKTSKGQSTKKSSNLSTNVKMSEEKKQAGNVGIAASIARKNILELHPYRCARDDYSSGVLLDANENAYGPTSLPSKCLDPYDNCNTLERYPDPYQIPLKELYTEYRGHGLKPENVFVGVGSDEAIDLLMRIFCNPAEDNILIAPPTYGMYKVCAKVNDVSIVAVPLTPDFDIRIPEMLDAATEKTKLLFICSPGNPTCKAIPLSEIEKVASSNQYKGLVVVDEAYVDFSDKGSAVELVNKYPNVVVLQTLSKAFGLAGIRCGFCIGSPDVIQLMNNVKAPYNVNSMTSEVAINAMKSISTLEKNIASLLSQRAIVAEKLAAVDFVTKVYPSDSNFLLFRVKDKAVELYKTMADSGVVTRYRGTEMHCDQCIRVTIGTEEQNDKFLELLQKTWADLQ